MSYYRKQVENLLDDWLNSSVENEKAKNVINCLLSWLAEDPYWFAENISQVDKEILKELIGRTK